MGDQEEFNWYAHAKARGLVRLPDGGTARLYYVPGTRPSKRERIEGERRVRKSGDKARVLLPSGAWLSLDVSDLAVILDES